MVIAFIPVRGGSKSIPLKNIKEFCGRPLVYWNLRALQQTVEVSQIVVATDSDKIADCVKSFDFDKVSIYKRSEENASDTASTESVMLEYLNSSKSISLDDDIFMLVQATSPLTETKHFSGALLQYKEAQFDSLLTCVRNKRFFWNQDGTPKNYDYRNRPRRQDFDGGLMENGAFYINTVGNILKTENRLSGKISVYEMPEYTAIEIDEENDWIFAENLMRKYVLPSYQSARSKIKLFLSDVDGVLTDSGMYYSENGDELKKFNTRDGVAFRLLKERGIKTGLITSEDTEIVSQRANKMQIDYLCQGKIYGGKLSAALDICREENISLEETAYIGDDENCVELLSNVGFAACPSDAMDVVKNISSIRVLTKRGGEGVVREFVELILNDRGWV